MDQKLLYKLPLKYQLLFILCFFAGGGLGWWLGFILIGSPFYVFAGPLCAIITTFAITPFLKSVVNNRQKAAIERAGQQGEITTDHFLSFLSGDYKRLRNIKVFDGTNSAENDHIVIGPSGIFLIETKNYSGTINITPSAWIREWDNGRREGVSSPVYQSERHKTVVSRFLAKNGLANIPLYLAVAIANEKAIIVGEDRIPVMKSEALTEWIGSFPNRIDSAKVSEIYSLFAPLETRDPIFAKSANNSSQSKLFLFALASIIIISGLIYFMSSSPTIFSSAQRSQDNQPQVTHSQASNTVTTTPAQPNPTPAPLSSNSVTKYNGKVTVTVTNVQRQSNSYSLGIKIENRSDKDVVFAVFGNMYLIDPTNQAIEANVSESNPRSFNIPGGSSVSGTVKFPYSGTNTGNFAFKTKMWVMDPSYTDRDFRVPFTLQ